jgi:hypothetical protein
MSGRVLRVTRYEVSRVLLSRRWVIVVVLCALGAYLAAGDVGLAVADCSLSPSAWDVHRAGLNSFMYIGYLVLVAYVALVGDSLVADRTNDFVRTVLPRAGGRLPWWAAKILSIVLVAAAIQLLFLILCLVVGVAKNGGSLSLHPSELSSAVASATAEGSGIVLFAPLSAGTNVAWHQLLMCLYETFAFSAVGVFFLALTARFSRAFIPIAGALMGLVADYILGHFFEGWWRLSPGQRLLESMHSTASGFPGLSWWSSVAYWGVLLAAAAVGGWLVMRKVDV